MKTITQVYDSYEQAASVVRALQAAGIDNDNVSLVANKYVSENFDNVDSADASASGAGIGAMLGGGVGLLAGLGLLAIPGLGPVVAAGWFASTAAGAIAGGAAGGVVGALVGAGVPEDDAHVYSEVVRRGGTMVTARVDDGMESAARDIMQQSSPVDVTARRAQYEGEGWTKFDPDAPAYRPTDEEIRRIRARSQV